MPRININYSNTIIYKLCCNDLSITEIYIGHTTDMRKRKNRHKSCCMNETTKGHNYYVYQFIRANGGWDNWDMIEIERFEAIDGNDARKKERYWIEELKATLNNKLPMQTQKEYHEKNKEVINEQNKIYRETHKEEKAITDKIYRENNKEKILERLLEKITCECGFLICRTNLKRHMKSQRHFDLMFMKEDIL